MLPTKIHVNEIPESGLDIFASVGKDPWLDKAMEETLASLASLVEAGQAGGQALERKLSGTDATLTLRVEKIGEMVLINGDLVGETDSECDYCLGKFRRKIGIKICRNLILQAATDKFQEEDNEFGTYKDNVVSIDEIIKEYVVLEKPISFVCRESCKGLCPLCGKNLNLETCNCRPY